MPVLGRNLFTSEGSLQGGLGSGPIMITPTRWCGNGMSAHLATPWSHKFRIWKSLYYFFIILDPLGRFWLEKNCGYEPRVKKLQLTCADRATNPDLPVT